eukprot:TRINITY_DN1733_c0_g3_i1.p1 TRINITY_DN1733_c0_g3~~TRINITY_DN1733_c0_g3_i1.p1  ORF type:complete len:156 (+),score=15.87 TRINITY_DN1733_c0_g3_i1:62-469(+)
MSLTENKPSSLLAFNAKQIPSIPLGEYIKRFDDYLQLSPSTYIVAYILMQRLLKRNPRSQINPLNVHRLLVAGITVAEKSLNDCYWRNTDYAIVGAISNEELNELEVLFLEGINYKVVVEEDEYIEALNKIHRRA